MSQDPESDRPPRSAGDGAAPEVIIEAFAPCGEIDLDKLARIAPPALALAVQKALPGSLLPALEEVGVALVDDPEISRVHAEFMDIPGATDVITFHHGEIVISVETARRTALDLGVDPTHETALYLVHGLLHLAGYLDAEDGDRAAMHALQDKILAEVWADDE